MLSHGSDRTRLRDWVAKAATEARTQAGVSQERVADLAGLRAVTIHRFEQAKHWPRDTDALLAAYAQAVGLEDLRDIYRRALELWWEAEPHR